MKPFERTLCRLAIGSDELVERDLRADLAKLAASHLDRKTHALVEIGSLVAVDAASPSYLPPVEAALAAGATEDEIVACLVTVIGTAGAARVVSAAPKLGLALGYDVAAALEESGVPLG